MSSEKLKNILTQACPHLLFIIIREVERKKCAFKVNKAEKVLELLFT
jgi:hypothetical protein